MLCGNLWLRLNVSDHLHTPCFQHTRPEAFARQPCVTRLPVWCALAAFPLFAADPKSDPKLDALLKNVESRYNRTQSLKLDFSETYAGISHAPSHTESGTLYLKKPGRMRWEYSFPAGKLFLSDGKDVILYTPDEHRAQKSRLKESEDMRAPLAFLLGKLDFAKEFKSFEIRPEGQDTWIVAEPKNPNVEFSRVDFLAAPDGEILKLRVTGITNAKIDFAFSNEMLNAPVSADRFIFHAPPGVEVVEGDQR
jgi:outer membrane lipoprotein carrier protein